MAKNKEKTSENKLEAIDLDRLVFKMLKELPERSGNIIIKRFNLDDKNAKTLDEIGKEYEITRERVRQIEGEAMIKLKDINKKYNLDEVFNHLKEVIEDHGGIMSEEKIIKKILDHKNFKANKQIVLFILSLDDKIKTLRKTKIYKKIYFYKKENVLEFKKTIEKIKNYLQEKNRSASLNEITELINKNSVKTIKSYLDANKIILENILGEWGYENGLILIPKI